MKIVRKYKCSLICWEIIFFYIFSSVDFEIVRLKSWVFSFFQIQIFFIWQTLYEDVIYSVFLMNNKAWIKKKTTSNMIAIWSESTHLCDKSVEIGYDICLAPKLNTCRSDCARMNTCVKFLRVVNTSLSIMKFIFFLFICLSKKKIPMASSKFEGFFFTPCVSILV